MGKIEQEVLRMGDESAGTGRERIWGGLTNTKTFKNTMDYVWVTVSCPMC